MKKKRTIFDKDMTYKEILLSGKEKKKKRKVNLVTFPEFVENKDYLNHASLSSQMYHEIEQLLGTDPYKILTQSRKIKEVCYLWGKGSGKSLLGYLVELYIIYLLLESPETPQEKFGISATDTISFVNVAGSLTQAKQQYFDRMVELLKEAPWFRKYYTIYDSNQRISDADDYRGNIKISKNEIEFPNHIIAYPLSSQNEKWEGKNVLFFDADELSGFKSEKGLDNAEKIYSSLITSTRELPYIGIITSYPRLDEKHDFTYLKLEESKKRDDMYGSTYHTWQIKPARFYSGEMFPFVMDKKTGKIINVPIEYKSKFDIDPEGSKAKYMALPTGAFDKYMDYFDSSGLIIQGKPIIEAIDNEEIVGDKIFTQKIIRKLEPYNYPLVITVDEGESHCDAAVMIGHTISKVIKDRRINFIKIVYCSIWSPDDERGVVVDVNNLTAFVCRICDIYNVRLLKMDFWNANSIKQAVMRYGVKIEIHSANAEDYVKTKNYLYSNRIIFSEQQESLECIGQVDALGPPKGAAKPKVRYGKQDLVDTLAQLVGELFEEDETMFDMPLGAFVRRTGPQNIKEVQEMESLEQLLGLKTRINKELRLESKKSSRKSVPLGVIIK